MKKASLEDVIALIKDQGLKDPAVREHFRYTQAVVNLKNYAAVVDAEKFECLNNIGLFRTYLYDLSAVAYFEEYLQRIRDNWHTVSPEAVDSFHKEIAMIVRQQELVSTQTILTAHLARKYPENIILFHIDRTSTWLGLKDSSLTKSHRRANNLYKQSICRALEYLREEPLSAEDKSICKAWDHLRNIEKKEGIINPENIKELIDNLRDCFKSLQAPEFLYLRYHFNKLQLFFNIEEAVRSFFEARFKGHILPNQRYKKYNPQGSNQHSEGQYKELATEKFWGILRNQGKEVIGIVEKCKTSTSSLSRDEKKKLKEYYNNLDKVVNSLALVKENKVDPKIKQALAAKIPEKSKEAKSTTAAATTATKPKTQSEPVVQTSKQEAPLSNQEVQNSTSHTEALAAATALQSSSYASEVPEDEVTQDFDAWHETEGQRQAVGLLSTEGPSQQKQAATPAIQDSKAQRFLDVVLGRSGYQPLSRRDFNAFLKAVGGKKLSMTQNGYITIPLADTTVETKYWVPNLADNATLNAVVCTIHQPHGNDPFPKLTINHFFKRQLAARGYGKLVSENEE